MVWLLVKNARSTHQHHAGMYIPTGLKKGEVKSQGNGRPTRVWIGASKLLQDWQASDLAALLVWRRGVHQRATS
jgi:hypothetical protein